MSTGRAAQEPLTPGGALLRRPGLLVATIVGFAVLALVVGLDVAAVDDLVDDPVRRTAVAGRTPVVDRAARVLTELGGGPVVVPLAVLVAAVVLPSSPPLAAACLLAVAARYGLEDVAKEAIGRDRPPDGALTEASGFAFPSGHALGATVGWGLVPAAVRARGGGERAWRGALALWATVVLVTATSRVWLGVHWLTDVTGSVLLGLVILVLVDVAGSPATARPRDAGTDARRRPRQLS